MSLSFDDVGSGPPLILLHGFPLDRRIWTEAAQELGQKFRVITPDLPGFGESESTQPFTIDSLATVIRDFLKSLGIDHFILGGLSMGGYVAQAYAARFPETLRGLILIDTKSAADSDEAKRGREQMVDLVRSKGSSAVAEQMFPKMITVKTIETKPHIAALVRSIMNNCRPLTIEHACLAMRDRADYTAALHTYNFLTQIITGSDDRIATPAIAKQMHAALRNARLNLIPSAAHLSPLEQPQSFSEAVLSFFT